MGTWHFPVFPMNLYASLARPLLFSVDPETVHHLAMGALSRLGPALQRFTPPRHTQLARTVFGVRFPNPVGLAAGFDKNAVALPAWQALGFGFAEAGTITSRAQPGNPKPRIFRVKECGALINRLGFNNEGVDAIADRLKHLKVSGQWPEIPIGINLGKSKVTPMGEATSDYLLSFERLQHFGDYFVLNISSPNTPGLRELQDRQALDDLLETIQRRNTDGKPILVKIAPDLEWSAIEEILVVAETHRVAGLIATNTTIDHSQIPERRRQQGGLSGAPLRERSTQIVRFIAGRSPIPIIAAGGIMDVDSALEKLDAGASLLQLYTGFIYEGPQLVRDICDAIVRRAS
jgi:dihydroorotate dehydrogenase